MNNTRHPIRTFATLAILLLLPACAAHPDLPPDTDPSDGWALTFSYSEVPPNAGAGAPASRLALSVRSDGHFEVSRAVEGLDGTTRQTACKQGTLTPDQLDELARFLLRQNITKLEATHLSLAGGSGTEDGWGGRLTFRHVARRVTFTFDSRGSIAVEPAGQALRRWGLSLVRFLETASHQLAAGSELPLGRALTETEAIQRALVTMGGQAGATDERFLRAWQLREIETGRSTWMVSYSSPLGVPNWSVTVDARTGEVLAVRRLPGR